MMITITIPYYCESVYGIFLDPAKMLLIFVCLTARTPQLRIGSPFVILSNELFSHFLGRNVASRQE